MSKELSVLSKLGESSQLRIDLNSGIAALQKAKEVCFHPHFCLNGKEGVEVIERISQDPKTANTRISITESSILSVKGFWLNIGLAVSLDWMSSKEVVSLSPRQTSYIIQNLPKESQTTVLETIYDWYFKEFLPDLEQGLAAVTRQMESRDYLMPGAYKNHVFDIQTEGSGGNPYVEEQIIGRKMFFQLFFGSIRMGQEPYKRTDDVMSLAFGLPE